MTSLEDPPLIERIRCKHEEIEKLERLVMKFLDSEKFLCPTKQGHCLRGLTKSIIVKTEELVGTYAAFTDETTTLSHQIETWRNVSSDFSYRLRQIHEYYGKHPSRRHLSADKSVSELLNEDPVIVFNSEEGFGRYLDLYPMYLRYTNSNFGERVEYSAYLDVFSQPEKIPLHLKLSGQYIEYMGALLEYLISFFQRTEPLQELDGILYKVEIDFKDQYADRKRKRLRYENELIPSQHTVMDTVEELLAMGLEKLKEEMAALGLNTGDMRSFLTVSLLEAKVKKLCNLLDETIERTKKKKALVSEEMEEGNPVNQAMGWDGKPIPYWLCKLGLGQEYKCAICGNYSYAGKRAFERHFKERRHQDGLQCLGIRDTEEKKPYGIEEKKPYGIEEVQKVLNKKKGLPLAHQRLWKFAGVIAEARVGVEIPPPHIRRRVEKVAYLVNLRGLEYEKEIIAICGDEDEEINFLKSSDDRYHAFYQHKLNEYKKKDVARIQSDERIAAAADGSAMKQGCIGNSVNPPLRLEPHKFTYSVPQGTVTNEDLDIIKLTAEFFVRYGHRHHQLDEESDFTYSRIVCGYREIINSSPKAMKEKLRKNAADMETVLENCYQRLQWERFINGKTRKWNAKLSKGYGRITQLPLGRFSKLVEETHPSTPLPPHQKIDESQLVPEAEFLAQNRGAAAIDLHIIKPRDAHLNIYLPSLSVSLASFKESIISFPGRKVELRGKNGLLEDEDKSFAYYNVGSGETLSISLS